MTKLLFALLITLISFQNTQASEKAFNVLLSYGFTSNDLVTVIKDYPELNDLDVASESYTEGAEEFTLPLKLKLYSVNSNTAYVITKTESDVGVEKIEVQLEMELKNVEGEIHGNLYETVLEDTDSKYLAQMMSDVFKDDFTTTKGMRGRVAYDLQVEQYFDEGKFVRYGNILNASVTVRSAIIKKILQIDPETFAWKLLPENFNLIDKPFYAPVKSSRVSSLFQLNRRHPIKRRLQPHNGVDFVSPSGAPVFPALEGEIKVIGRTRSKGKYIIIAHDNGYETTYDHLKKFAKGLRAGDRVELDDQIGEVGSTGYSTGAHLHFGVMKDGRYVNPLYLLKSYCYDQKDEFENLAELDESEE